MKQILIIIAILYLTNGLAMLAAPMLWYQLTPGVIETGPFNSHFIRDIGLAFVAASCSALLIFSIRYKKFAAIAAPVILIGGHGAFHLLEFFHHQPSAIDIARDLALIVIPSIAFCVLLISHHFKMENIK